MKQLQVIDAPDQRFRISLGGVQYDFRLKYNVAAESWYMDVEVDSTPKVSGRRITSGANLLRAVSGATGQLYAVQLDATSSVQDQYLRLTEGSLALLWVSPEEVASYA